MTGTSDTRATRWPWHETRANLAVSLAHRGQAITGVEDWRVAVTRTEEARRWLLERLPDGLRATALEHTTRSGWPALRWEYAPRYLVLHFRTPHDVGWMRDDGDTCEIGTFNLAMNLQEITDMVRWAVEGR